MSFDDHLHRLARRYASAPQWAKMIAGGSYSLLPLSMRFGPRYSRYDRLFRQERVDPAYVAARLSETLHAALSQVPAYATYRRLLPEVQRASLDVLRELPLVAKGDIKAALNDYIAIDQPAHRRLRMLTGGSTAIPMAIYLHKGVSRAKEWAAFNAM